MKISNFRTSELEEYFNTGKTIFFNYKKCFLLQKVNEKFNFKELPEGKTRPGELPHSKRGRFYAFNINGSYCKDYNLKVKEHETQL